MTFQQPSDDELMELGLFVAETAHEIFCKCDAEADFCMQNAGGGVFGAVNRLIFTNRGWWASPSHCNAGFLKKWRKISRDFQPSDGDIICETLLPSRAGLGDHLMRLSSAGMSPLRKEGKDAERHHKRG